jgi:hypothetical protein
MIAVDCALPYYHSSNIKSTALRFCLNDIPTFLRMDNRQSSVLYQEATFLSSTTESRHFSFWTMMDRFSTGRFYLSTIMSHFST